MHLDTHRKMLNATYKNDPCVLPLSTSLHFPGSFETATSSASSLNPWISTKRSRSGSTYVNMQREWWVVPIFKKLLAFIVWTLFIHTISIFCRSSERLLADISLTGIPLKFSDMLFSSKLFMISGVPNTVKRMAVSGAVVLCAFGKELRLIAFSFSTNRLL